MSSQPTQRFCPVYTAGLGFNSLAYVQWTPSTEGEYKPLVCVHGLSRNGRDFDPVARRLSETQGFTVFCPDVLGRGKSDFLPETQFAQYNNINFSAHMISLISRVTKEYEKIDYFGTSMGGIIGMILASAPNTPIKRLILNDIGPVLKLEALQRIEKGLHNNQSRFKSLEEARPILKQRYKTFGIATEEEWDFFIGITLKQDGDEYVMHYDPLINKAFVLPEADIQLWTFWDAIKCPVLLLRGKDSDLIDSATVEEMKTRGPKDFTVVEFDQVGHAPTIYSDEQIKPVTDWLQL